MPWLPELSPRRRSSDGRISGARAFEWYVGILQAFLSHHSMSFDAVDDVITKHRGVEEVILHLGVALEHCAMIDTGRACAIE